MRVMPALGDRGPSLRLRVSRRSELVGKPLADEWME